MLPLFLSVIAPIAAIFACRMLGLFMLIPVFTPLATHLLGATPVLIGLALGGYGLSQGLMQIPFGMLSDYYGRKPIITLGLLLFALGSLLGALTHSIWGMIIARTIQGLGAIGSVLIALLADLTPDKLRTFSMAILGVSISLSFGVAFILSPLITEYAGLAGIFYFTLLLIALALIVLHTVIPTPPALTTPTHTKTIARLREVIGQFSLLRLNLGIFCQHFIFTASFFFIPLRLSHATWHFYLPLLLLSFIIMALLVYYSEKKQVKLQK
jgi:MFS family permease